MVQKLSGPHAMTATALSDEVGVAQGTLSRWLKSAATVGRKMSAPDEDDKSGDEDKTRPSTPAEWDAEAKVALVMEAMATPNTDLGAFLRRKGVHEAQLVEWRKQVTEAAVAAMSPPKPLTRAQRIKKAEEVQEIRRLQRELARKDKALAETAALIVLKKKAQEIWGDVDDDTDPKSDE